MIVDVSRTWPDNWDALRSGTGCRICEQGRVDQDEWGVRFFTGNVSDAYLMRRPPQPGYAVVTFRGRHVSDPTDLTVDELAAWWADIRVAAQAIIIIYKPCHLNYEILGNSVPHVHVHVIPRYLDDPAPGRPIPDSLWQHASELSASHLLNQVAALQHSATQYGGAETQTDSITLVQRGYDTIDERYSPWAQHVDPPLRLPYIERVLAMADSPPSRAVELGCGPGLPVGRFLAERCSYLGVDLSAAMLRRAAVNVPTGVFIQADMTRLALAANSIDLVVAFYSITHLPRDRHSALFQSVAEWLRPGGWFVATLGTGDNPGGTEADWLGGGPMFWSGFDVETNVKLLRQAGLEVQDASVVDQSELGNPVQFLWVIARRPLLKNNRG
jgi:diadenosine tetraphosphate (Ap4A) HIT family hydrolase/SAM-dependent methyltransferase